MSTFEQMPDAIAEISYRLVRIEEMLTSDYYQRKEPSDVLNITEASELLNLTVPTIYSKVSKKELPYAKRGKKLYFSRRELTEFINEGRVKTTAEIQQDAILAMANVMKKGGC